MPRQLSSLQPFHPLIQFVCVESLVTALVDMYPQKFRRKHRREILILVVAVVCFLLGLVMLTEVRVWGAGRAPHEEEEQQGSQGSCLLATGTPLFDPTER